MPLHNLTRFPVTTSAWLSTINTAGIVDGERKTFQKEDTVMLSATLVLCILASLMHLTGLVVVIREIFRQPNRSLRKRKCIMIIFITLTDLAYAIAMGSPDIHMLLETPQRPRNSANGSNINQRGSDIRRKPSTTPAKTIFQQTRSNISVPRTPPTFKLNTTATPQLGNKDSMNLHLTPLSNSTLFFCYMFTMLCTTFNMLLITALHVKYRATVTPKRLAMIFTLGWLLGIALGVTEVFTMELYQEGPAMMSTVYFRITSHAIFLILTISMYGFIISQMRKQSTLFGRQKDASTFKLTYLIVGSYIIFYTLPDVVKSVFLLTDSIEAFEQIGRFFRVLPLVGIIVDAIIYLLIDKGVRAKILRRTRRLLQQPNILRKCNKPIALVEIPSMTNSTAVR